MRVDNELTRRGVRRFPFASQVMRGHPHQTIETVRQVRRAYIPVPSQGGQVTLNRPNPEQQSQNRKQQDDARRPMRQNPRPRAAADPL